MLYLKIASEPPYQVTRATHWLDWVPTRVCPTDHSPELLMSRHLLESSMKFLSKMNTLCSQGSDIIAPLSEMVYHWVLTRHSERLLEYCPHLMQHLITFIQDCSSIRSISVQGNSIFIFASTISGNQIWSISKTDASLDFIYDTAQLRALVLSEVADPWKWLWELGVDWVEHVMDLLQEELNATRQLPRLSTGYQIIDFRREENFTSQYRRKCLKALRYLAKTFCVLPNSFSVNDVIRIGTHAVSGGGFADIWLGRLNNMNVCLKVLRIFTSNGKVSQQVLKEFCEEALVWKQLDHPNVLPFIGVNEILFSPSYCFISPWMKNGNIMTYLENHPEQNRLLWISQVADGLQYLHGLDPPIIHGDIRGANILIMDDFNCCLADFGLALVTESPSLHEKSLNLRGSVRWMSPEILDPKLFHLIQPKSRDIYAFGCTVVEILSGKVPFQNIKYDVAVISQVLRGCRPEIPASLAQMSGDLPELVSSCWDPMPSRRPTADDISTFLSFYIPKEDHGISGDFCAWLISSLISNTI
ncbi:kinase-like domain-containing protein [Lentinula edodes]|nr:kinase-like domain-containing protein [Lentinula edodes]